MSQSTETRRLVTLSWRDVSQQKWLEENRRPESTHPQIQTFPFNERAWKHRSPRTLRTAEMGRVISLCGRDVFQQKWLERESPVRSPLIHRFRNSSFDDRGQEATKLVATEDCGDETKHSFSAREMRPSRRAWRKRSLSGIQSSMDLGILPRTHGELETSRQIATEEEPRDAAWKPV